MDLSELRELALDEFYNNVRKNPEHKDKTNDQIRQEFIDYVYKKRGKGHTSALEYVTNGKVEYKSNPKLTNKKKHKRKY